MLVLTPDDVIYSRGADYNIARDNVLFELGLFIGTLGSERVFVLLDSSIDTKILSDYNGITMLRYNGKRLNKELRQAVSPACVEIKTLVNELGPRRLNPRRELSNPHGVLPSIGIDQIYASYASAEADILAAMKGSVGPIRLFFQIASQDINAKGTIFDSLSEVVERSGVEIRVLHAGVNSPLFSRDRLISLGKNPDSVLRSLKHVEESLAHLESITGSSLRRRPHDYPFIWRIYGFNDSLYLMPYFSQKDAATKSPVLKFKKSSNSMYHSFVDWFDHAWNNSSPSKVFLDQIITPATPCGTALFLEWEGFHVFGIPKRDIIEGSEYIRFYGLGGKRKSADELLEDCSLREGNEESGGAVSRLKSAETTDFYRSDGVIEKIIIEAAGPKPRLLYQKREHTGLGTMKRDGDYYYMVGYLADLKQKPFPTREIAAILFANDRHLEIISRRNDVNVGQLLAAGAQVIEQPGVAIKPQKILVPHGTASYLVRLQTR